MFLVYLVVSFLFFYILYHFLKDPFPRSKYMKRKYTSENVEKEEYDFILVGSGSAGSVLASKLVRGGHTVLLLENGPELHKREEICNPATNFGLQNTELDYCYRTVKQPGCLNKEINAPRGNLLGGSSTINACMFVRGCKQDFDRWEKEHGCVGWSWEQLLPSSKYCENYKEGGDTRGKHGPIHPVAKAKDSKVNESIIQTIENSGLSKRVPDINS